MSNPLTTAEIYVKYQNQAYVTNRVRGISSSSTSSAESAAKTQAEKLFGPSLISLELLSPKNVYITLFEAKADAPQIAYCWANGMIEFADTLPDGAMQIATGPARALQAKVQMTAIQIEYEGPWFVPGLREAEQQDEAALALQLWLRNVGPTHNASKLSHGCTFVVPAAAQPAAPARRAA